MVLAELGSLNPSIKFQVRQLLKKCDDAQKALHTLLLNYLKDYCDFYRLTPKEVNARYALFLNQYVDDLKRFELLGKYPVETVASRDFQIDRVTYDIFLIITALITAHRFQLMEEVYHSAEGSRGLIIGLGAGIELQLVRQKFQRLDAYDLSISEFVYRYFNDVHLNAMEFTGQKDGFYDRVYAIELFEHLKTPEILLKNIYDVLNHGGELICTIAVNVPQFDHLINFRDIQAFEKELTDCGFGIDRKNEIPHDYRFTKVAAKNILYKLKK